MAPASTSSIVFSLLSHPLPSASLAWELRGVFNDQKLSPCGLEEKEKAIHEASLHKLIYIHPSQGAHRLTVLQDRRVRESPGPQVGPEGC